MAISFSPQALPNGLFKVTDELGETPILFSEQDWIIDHKTVAANKAAELEDRGTVGYLWQGTRHFMVTSGHKKEARLVEALYHAGFSYGYITAKEAAKRLEPTYRPHCKDFTAEMGRALEGMAEFLESPTHFSFFEKAEVGEILTKYPTTILVGKNVNNSPQSHKKGQGSGARRGPKEKSYFIPPKWVLNFTFGAHDKRELFIPVRALGSSRTYAAYVGKVKVVENNGQISGKQTELAGYLNVGRKTFKEYMELAGCRLSPKMKMVRLSADRVAAMAKDPKARKAARKAGTQHYRRIQDEHGKWSNADHQSRCEKGLEGKIYAEMRVGTIVKDEDFDAWLGGNQNG